MHWELESKQPSPMKEPGILFSQQGNYSSKKLDSVYGNGLSSCPHDGKSFSRQHTTLNDVYVVPRTTCWTRYQKWGVHRTTENFLNEDFIAINLKIFFFFLMFQHKRETCLYSFKIACHTAVSNECVHLLLWSFCRDSFMFIFKWWQPPSHAHYKILSCVNNSKWVG